MAQIREFKPMGNFKTLTRREYLINYYVWASFFMMLNSGIYFYLSKEWVWGIILALSFFYTLREFYFKRWPWKKYTAIYNIEKFDEGTRVTMVTDLPGDEASSAFYRQPDSPSFPSQL